MRYMGSKSKHAPYILNLILDDLGESIDRETHWIEPFVGGANIIDKVGTIFHNRIGNDINVHLIETFKALQNGWMPPITVSEEEYKRLQVKGKINVIDEESNLIGFVGVGCSFAGKWFGGYARDKDLNNYCLQSRNALLAQKLTGIKFVSGNYDEFIIPPKSIVYCDPPYENTTKYKNSQFDHGKFWKWAESLTNTGNYVYVSEYKSPEKWKCIWKKKVISSLDLDTGSKQATECLFKL